MEQQFDLEKEYGIVLEGGGAKGAYQIGVWKALKECGVNIKGIAGVSVGALNGALMCMDDVAYAEEIWNNISYSQVMDVDDEEMSSIINKDLKNLKLKRLTINSAKAVSSGGIDITPLKNLLRKYVDEEKIRASEKELVIGTLSLTDRKGLEIEVKNVAEGQLNDYLIASASLPLFKQEKLEGKTYLDGGMVNNVPVDMLIKRGYHNIIVIRIYGIGVERKVKIPDDVQVIEIAPRVELGSILEFNPHKASRNIKIGYYDAMRAIKNLQGKIYYISEVKSEEEHLLELLHVDPMVKMALIEYFKEDYSDENLYNRKMFEVIIPKIADKLGLTKTWTYTQLYLSMLELAAKTLKIKKYAIYTENEFKDEIKNSYENSNQPLQQGDLFVELIIRAMAL